MQYGVLNMLRVLTFLDGLRNSFIISKKITDESGKVRLYEKGWYIKVELIYKKGVVTRNENNIYIRAV